MALRETIAFNMRGIDAALWRRLRIEAIRRDQTLIETFNQMLADWLKDNENTAPPATENGVAK